MFCKAEAKVQREGNQLSRSNPPEPTLTALPLQGSLSPCGPFAGNALAGHVSAVPVVMVGQDLARVLYQAVCLRIIKS